MFQISPPSKMRKRIQKELEAFLADPPPGCSVLQMGDDLSRWQVKVQGPPESSFEGGNFTLLVTFPPDYPFKPPKVKFETRIFHPNINQSGDICLDTLASQWAPSFSMAQVNDLIFCLIISVQVMLSIIQLLSHPNPSDPINLEAARMLQQDPESYHRRVRLLIMRQKEDEAEVINEAAGGAVEVEAAYGWLEQEGGDGEAGQEGQQGADDLDADVAEEDEADEEENNVDP